MKMAVRATSACFSTALLSFMLSFRKGLTSATLISEECSAQVTERICEILVRNNETKINRDLILSLAKYHYACTLTE